ncbi:hypothetical protein [Paractinoplanes brasiliensis]|uniref:Uncharacterized protein n=1 Tax=Paractinoplanes brasiliensis TaxID=52695 RepID=A0A4R6JYR6_9ACTN|nr:hypothetical protein [Actinoplanes brasiliensis]TDO41994.1 hypothetical protein C8E87_5756 [Actinoplanes brasiliensis]GID29725.1 hypothetical protein Abr02nite_47080 [Actinoplanes brasiliensis]
MTGSLSAGDVERALRLAGLPARVLGDDDPGGFSVQASGSVVLVAWTPAEELLAGAAQAMLTDPGSPALEHLGRVTGIMRQAMIDILRSAGLDAQPVTGEYGPGDVEVRGRL